jgi:hypothetical protein
MAGSAKALLSDPIRAVNCESQIVNRKCQSHSWTAGLCHWSLPYFVEDGLLVRVSGALSLRLSVSIYDLLLTIYEK